jgi:hypothetical protein
MTEAKRSSETSVLTRGTQHYSPQDDSSRENVTWLLRFVSRGEIAFTEFILYQLQIKTKIKEVYTTACTILWDITPFSPLQVNFRNDE